MTVAVVTGAYGAIGKAIARQLAEREHAVVVVGRDPERAAAAAAEIRAATGNERVRHEVVDLSRRASIDAFAQRWEGPLHVLVNNAATTPRTREVTPEGLEVQFATNVLGYLWMADAFTEILAASAPSRIVNVASYWAGDLDITDLQFERRRYDNDDAYRQSKQANRMLTAALAERLAERRIAVNSCHPGDTPSKLASDLGFGGHQTPDQCADTPVWVATNPAGLEASGKYFKDRRQQSCPFCADAEAVEALYRLCAGV